MDRDTGYLTDLIYTDHYYEQLAPIALNYAAALDGWQPRDLREFAYCELGCGLGRSLLLHAGAHPGSRFVGIDLNAEHVRQAEARARAAGVDNARFVAEPLGAVAGAPALGKFDFVVLHGLYSYVGDAGRADILRFLDHHVAPGGLVLVSYNALPGYSGRRAIGELMRRFARPLSENSLERVELGLSCLRLMLNARVPFFRPNPELAAYAESLFGRDPRYLAHEFFHEHWDAFGVADVAAHLRAAGLEFAATLPAWQNHAEADVPPGLADFFAMQTDRVAREAYKDFIDDTPFRTDLFIRAAAGGAQRVGREAALWQMPFGAAVPAESVRLAVTCGHLELGLNTREGRLVLGELQDGPRTPAQLAAHPALQAMAPAALVETVCRWTLSEQVLPAVTTGTGADEAAPIRLNTALAVDAVHDDVGGEAWLVSRRFGRAFRFDSVAALALCAVAGSAGSSAEERLCGLLEDSGLTVEEDGAPMPRAALQSLASDLRAELATGGALAQAQRLGVVP